MTEETSQALSDFLKHHQDLYTMDILMVMGTLNSELYRREQDKVELNRMMGK